MTAIRNVGIAVLKAEKGKGYLFVLLIFRRGITVVNTSKKKHLHVKFKLVKMGHRGRLMIGLDPMILSVPYNNFS